MSSTDEIEIRGKIAKSEVDNIFESLGFNSGMIYFLGKLGVRLPEVRSQNNKI